MLALLLSVAAMAAAEPPLELRFVTPTPLDCGRGSLMATAEGVEPVSGTWSIDSATTLILDRSRTWTIEAASDRCWVVPQVVAPDTSAAAFAVWPRRTLGGRIAIPRGSSGTIDHVEVRLASPPRTRGQAVPETTTRCPVTDGAFRCDVPAVPLDLRIAASGFAPVYLWDVDAENVGELRLSSGAIVTGRASVSGDESPEGITVELQPASLAWSPDDQKRNAAQTALMKTNARGFFQFGNVPPGEYVAVATKAGWARAEYRVHVSPVTNEAVVGRELVLPPLSRIEVFITPPVDAQQRPWKVQLGRAISMGSTPLAGGTATTAGEWSYGGLDAGVYTIDVKDASGANVALEGVEVTGGTVRVPVRIDQVAVRGTVTLAGDPVAAWLRFNDGYGKVVTLPANAEGRFSGTLPKEGQWDVEVRRRQGRARVELQQVEVRRSDDGYAELALELPEGRIQGTVKTADGAPVDQASVTVRRGSDRKRIGGATTGPDGSFELDGLETGDVIVGASAKGAESELVPHRISKGKGEPLDLVVRSRHTIRGRLLSPDGRPVAGAEVHSHSRFSGGWREEFVTGPRGEFSVRASPGATHVPVAIVALGFPVKLTMLPVRQETVEVRFAPVPGLLFVGWNRSDGRLPVLGAGNGPGYGIVSFLGGPNAPPGMPARRVPGGVEVLVEPGQYSVCYSSPSRCETRYIAAGARETIDTRKWDQ